MTREWKEKLRWWMLRSQRSHAFAALLREASQFVMWWAGRRLIQVEGVAAVFSRHTNPRSPTFVPGQSDLDLTIVLEDELADDPQCIRQCSQAMQQLYQRYLFTKPEDARFVSRSELSRMTKGFCSPYELLCRPENWLLISGREIRSAKSRPFPSRLVPRHPEFNRWWQNVIQNQFFGSDTGLKNGYMRSLYRSAVKNQVHLEAANGVNVSKPEGFVSDELAGLKFSENPRLLCNSIVVLYRAPAYRFVLGRDSKKNSQTFLDFVSQRYRSNPE